MKKDIPSLKVTDVAIAIVPRKGNDSDEDLWDCYLVNLKTDAIKTVMVNTKGYGEVEGEDRKTSVLRHFFEEVGPERAVQIEPIQVKLFGLTNEFWISFVYRGHMYDKKYVFVKGSIDKMNFTEIPFLNEQGVMIK